MGKKIYDKNHFEFFGLCNLIRIFYMQNIDTYVSYAFLGRYAVYPFVYALLGIPDFYSDVNIFL